MLYIVGTPIGNLDDLSYRQAATIASSDIILTEDTRGAGYLFERIKKLFNLDRNPTQHLISYYKEREFEKLPEVMELLENNTVSLISQSGMPLISDPGELLIKTCIKRNIQFEVIPGPTAVITALVYSGFNTQNFMFLGFLPKKNSEIVKILSSISQISTINKDVVFVFYDSPKRINNTLELIEAELPDAHVVIARELTKKFEEILRGKPSEFKDHTFKGELTVALKIP